MVEAMTRVIGGGGGIRRLPEHGFELTCRLSGGKKLFLFFCPGIKSDRSQVLGFAFSFWPGSMSNAPSHGQG